MSILNAAANTVSFAAPRFGLVLLLVGEFFVIGAAALRNLEFANAPEKISICADPFTFLPLRAISDVLDVDDNQRRDR